MKPEDVVFIRTQILKLSQVNLAKKMGYKAGTSILAFERHGAIVGPAGAFEQKLTVSP